MRGPVDSGLNHKWSTLRCACYINYFRLDWGCCWLWCVQNCDSVFLLVFWCDWRFKLVWKNIEYSFKRNLFLFSVSTHSLTCSFHLCLEFADCESTKSPLCVWVQTQVQDLPFQTGLFTNLGKPFLWPQIMCMSTCVFIIMCVNGVFLWNEFSVAGFFCEKICMHCIRAIHYYYHYY